MGPRSAVFLPDAFSHRGGSAFGATAHDDVHGAIHGAFMTPPPYTRTSAGEVHSRGLGVRNCSHRALSEPLSEQSELREARPTPGDPRTIGRVREKTSMQANRV